MEGLIPNHGWLHEFVSRTSYMNSPPVFRTWAGLAALSAACQRKRWTVVRGEQMFTNLYIILVGPPGSGKTRAIRAGQQCAVQAGVKLFSSKASKEACIETLCDIRDVFTYEGMTRVQSAVSGFFDELMAFLPVKEYEFMALLTDWYDCPSVWIYRTRSHGEERAENVFVSFIAGITPRNMVNVFGQTAFGTGFLSRINFVYCEDEHDFDPFSNTEVESLDDLGAQLNKITSGAKALVFSDPAKAAVRSWIAEGMPPLPSDSRFVEYNARRWMHWLKIAMLFAVSRGDSVISDVDVGQARALLLYTEQEMPLAFEHLGQNPMAEAVKTIHRWAMLQHATNGRKGVPESAVVRKLLDDIPQQYHKQTIQYLLDSKLFTVTGNPPNRTFFPIPQR